MQKQIFPRTGSRYAVTTLTGIIIILLAAVIAVGGIFLYLQKSQIPMTNVQSSPNVQSSNMQTADWKTYRNDEYGFEFKYPSDMNDISTSPVIEHDPTQGITYKTYRYNDDNLKHYGLNVAITASQSVDGAIKKITSSPYAKDLLRSEITISGVKSYEFTVDGPKAYLPLILIPLNNSSYVLITEEINSQMQDDPLILQQVKNDWKTILLTFKLTK